MRISGAFPSEFLKAADLQGKPVTVVMERVEIRDVGDDRKPVLYFEGKEKGLVLNKTNSNAIAAVYGEETDDWQGQPIVLFEAQVEYQGKMGPALRVRVPPRQPARTPAREAPPPAAPSYERRGVDDDEVPF